MVLALIVQMRKVNAQGQSQALRVSSCDLSPCERTGLGPPRMGGCHSALNLLSPPGHFISSVDLTLGVWSLECDLPQGGGLVLSTEVPGPLGHTCPVPSSALYVCVGCLTGFSEHILSFLTPWL